MKKKNYYCAVIAHHLNVSYGKILSAADVADLLYRGTYKSFDESSLKGALLYSIFECSPDTLGWACLQAGSSLEKLNNLYMELLVKGFPKNKSWERIMREACVTE